MAPSSASRAALLHLAIVAAWLASFYAARLLEYAPHASLWFPPAGVTVAALLVLGWRALPPLWVACTVATVLADVAYNGVLDWSQVLATSAVFALAHTAAYGVAVLALRRAASGRSRHEATLRSATAFLLFSAVGAGLAAVLGAYGLAITGVLEAAAVPRTLVPWWIGDYAGVLALAPLAALLLERAVRWAGVAPVPGLPRAVGEFAPRAGLSFLAKLALLLGLSTLVLVAHVAFPEQPAILYLLFVSVVLQLWIVYTEGMPQALLSVACFSLLLALLGARLSLGEDALLLQFALIGLAANSYFALGVPALYADNRRLRKLLTHDPMTGALSRAFFEDRAREGVQAALRRREPAALLMIDLDRLKEINDRFGHAAGDAALALLSSRCRGALRPWDQFGRLGGDEFCAFLPGATEVDCTALLGRLRREVEARTVPGTDVRLSASFGSAALQPDDDYERMLARADREMYAAKRRQ